MATRVSAGVKRKISARTLPRDCGQALASVIVTSNLAREPRTLSLAGRGSAVTQTTRSSYGTAIETFGIAYEFARHAVVRALFSLAADCGSAHVILPCRIPSALL